MERVAFILMHSEDRISCLLNPQSLQLKRIAGIEQRASIGGAFVSSELSDMPLIHTGGGSTELTLDLLFDISVSGSSIATDDVRDLTSPFWEMAENMIGSDGHLHPPQVRFVWGKSWNIPGVILAVAENFDRFTKDGSPTRSWMRIKLLRVLEHLSTPVAAQFRHRNVLIPVKRQDTSENGIQQQTVASDERLDILALRYYGDPSCWRLLALFNDIADPLHPDQSSPLYIPQKSQLERSE